MRLALAVVVIGAAVLLGAGPAAAKTNECRGLTLCLPVAGPWVVVPAPQYRVQFQLSCPRGYVVGGLDAELADRGIDIAFVGKLGSPVGPGVTTERSTLFVATSTARRVTTFRPHLGCLPGAGGGRGPVPFSLGASYPPGQPTIRRVRTLSVRRPGVLRTTLRCGPGETLISAWSAVGLYRTGTPDRVLLTSVASTLAVRRGRAVVSARAQPAVVATRAVLQIGAVCAGAR